MTLRPAFSAILLLAAGAALSPAQAAGERTINVTVYGNDPCPHGSDDEIVVCGRRPEGERYRIPKELRRKAEDRPSEVSWASRVGGLEDQARAQRPDSCSPVGSYGQTGCFAKMIRDWASARQQLKSDSSGIP